MFSWQEQYLTRSLRSREILFLPLEHKIHIFSPPCNILYLYCMSYFEQVPAAILHFNWDSAVLADIEASGTAMHSNYLKPELLRTVED